MILNGYVKPTAAVVDTTMDTALRNNIAQVAASSIAASNNVAFVIPANTQDTQFYSTEQNGSSDIKMQVFTRAGKQLYGSTLTSSEQTALITSGNGFSTTAAYDSTYNNQTGSNAYMDVSVTVANPTLTNPVPATATMTISGSAIKATDTMTMSAGSATFTHTFAADANLATSAAAYVAAWNASTDANVSLYTASNSAGAITITEDTATTGTLTFAGSVARVGVGSNIAVATPAAAGTTGVKGDLRDYFAMAGSLKEDLLVFVTGAGTAEVSGQWGNLAVVDVREQLRQNIDVQFAANASSYVLTDSTTNTNIASGTYTAGSTIEHNGWTVSFDAPIQANDKFSVRGNSAQAGDNRNLLKLIELQDNKDIFSGRGDFTEVYTDIIGDLGYSVVQSAVSRDAQQIIFDQAQAKRDETSAVSLDEEAADMLRYQQAYQASAQIISTATKLFDTILGIR